MFNDTTHSLLFLHVSYSETCIITSAEIIEIAVQNETEFFRRFIVFLEIKVNTT